MERGILAGILPGGAGHLIGSANNWEALNMDRTGWSKQFSPSLFDVATFGIFAGPGYDQAVLNAENRNIAGRPGLFGPKSPYMDYTHSYGGPRTQLGPLGPIQQSFYDDLFGINTPGIDPFSGGVSVGPPSGRSAGFDDIGDIDPASQDPFGDIADALGLGEDTMGGDTTADDGVGFEP